MAKKKGANPNPPPPDDDDDDEGETPFSDRQREEITSLVNAAVSGQLGRKLKGAITGALDEALTPIREQLEQGGRRAARNDDIDDDDDVDDDEPPQRGKGKRGGKGRDPEFLSMQKKLAKLEDERKAEREQAHAREKDSIIRDHLTKIGVDPNRMRGAAAVVGGAVKRDEKTGTFSYTAKREGYDDDLDVEAGIKEWASSDEGKSYLAPPKGQQAPRGGSGMRPAPAGGGGGPVLGGGRPTQDPKAAKTERRANAVAQLGEAIGALSGGTVGLG